MKQISHSLEEFLFVLMFFQILFQANILFPPCFSLRCIGLKSLKRSIFRKGLPRPFRLMYFFYLLYLSCDAKSHDR